MCNTILTTNVAVVGTNLVLTIPAGTYQNCGLYPVRQKSGHSIYANQLKTRRNYVLHVAADTGTFTLIRGILNTCNCGTTAALPVPTTGA